MLSDGTYVVLWEDKRVQELLTGRYRDYDHKSDFGHAVTDYELKQLRAAGRVEHYNSQYIWLYPLPEMGRFGERKVLGRGNRIRAYYLSTPFPRAKQDELRGVLEKLELNDQLQVRTREGAVVILGKNGIPFRTLEAAETILTSLKTRLPQVFSHVIVAFIETDIKQPPPSDSSNDLGKLSLDDIIASQTNTSQIAGKHIVLAVRHEDERDAFGNLMEELGLEVDFAASAGEALQLLEDRPPHLLITDIELPDMHAFQMLNKVKEIESLRELPVMVLTDQTNFGMTVAKVEYLQRPISIARLRHNIWMALADTAHSNLPSDKS